MAYMDIFSFAIKEKEQPFPFSFRGLEEWQTILKKNGYDVLVVKYYGFPSYEVHQQPSAIFILRREGN